MKISLRMAAGVDVNVEGIGALLVKSTRKVMVSKHSNPKSPQPKSNMNRLVLDFRISK